MSRAKELADLGGSADAGGITGRNIIINGAMTVDQRTQTTTATGYTVDRFHIGKFNFDELVIAVTQDTDNPSGNGFANSLKLAVTTAESGIAADELLYYNTRLEGQNLQNLCYGTSSAKSLTLSFWVKSPLAGKHAVTFYQTTPARSNLQSYTVSSANTWEYKTITIDGDALGNIANDNSVELYVYWPLAGGSDYHGTPHTGWGAYSATDDFMFSDQVNLAGQTGNFFLTGVQLEVGSATPFEHEPFAVTKHKCQRYYQRAGNVSGFFTNTTGRVRGVLVGETGMRAAPTASNTTGLTLFYKNTSTGASAITIFTAPVNFRNGPASFIDFDTVATSTVQGQGCAGDSNTDARYFELDAEL